MNQTSPRRSGCTPILFLTLLLVVVLMIGYYRVTSKVETNYGKPDPRLGNYQRLKQTLLLYREDSLLFKPNILAEETKIVIEIAEPVNSICAKLEAEGAVANAQFMCGYLIYKGLDRDLQAGQFTILPQSTSLQVAQRITDPKLKDVLFTVYPGWRLEEVAEAIRLAGLPLEPVEIINAFKYPMNESITSLFIPPNTSLEGYLCPENYALKPETQLIELVEIITACQLDLQYKPGLLEAINSNGLDYHGAMTLASIIQRETLDTNEMPIIASVFYNRLAQGMMLQTDPTVQYALGFDDVTKSWWKSPLTYTDLEVESPYNTYRVFGLPPGPISTPSDEAIMAVAYPAETDFFYFRAKCDGSLTHAFSQTYEEHLSNACP